MLGRLWIAILGVLALSGCGVVSTCDDGGGGIRLFGKDMVEQKLEIGVKQFEDGNYAAALTALQGVLDAKSASRAQRVRANKYMAFIHCVSSREKQCKEHFRNVLEINPDFELSPAEVGHPVWGAAFRSVKGKIAK